MRKTKKILSVMLAATMMMAMSVPAFAATSADQNSARLTKEYKLSNSGTTSPAENFTFSAQCTNVTDAGIGSDGNKVTTSSAPNLIISPANYAQGEAGTDNKTKVLNISLPDNTNWPAVGVYTYQVSETNNNTAGVTYSNGLTLVVTVVQGEDGLSAVYAAKDDSDKTDVIVNTYSAGSLTVEKQVTGNLGDRNKNFNVTVTFNAPTGPMSRFSTS